MRKILLKEDQTIVVNDSEAVTISIDGAKEYSAISLTNKEFKELRLDPNNLHKNNVIQSKYEIKKVQRQTNSVR